MRKLPVYTYPALVAMLFEARERKNVSAVLILAMDEWRKGKFNDVVFSDLLYKCAEKVLEFT